MLLPLSSPSALYLQASGGGKYTPVFTLYTDFSMDVMHMLSTLVFQHQDFTAGETSVYRLGIIEHDSWKGSWRSPSPGGAVVTKEFRMELCGVASVDSEGVNLTIWERGTQCYVVYCLQSH